MKEFTEEQQKMRKNYLKKPVNQLKIDKKMTVRSLVENFSNMSIQARNLGRAAKIWEQMTLDKGPSTIFLGLAGPLIAAGLRNVISDLIRKNLIDVVVSTGAIMYQDFFYSQGYSHYIGTTFVDDANLGKLRINRIYDVFSDDLKFQEVDDLISDIADSMKPGIYSSRQFMKEIGATIDDKNSIIKACFDTGKHIFVPAINDSSIGIGLLNHWSNRKDGEKVIIDSIKDNHEIVQIILKSKNSSAVYIGGGVPKNFVNDAVVMANFDFGAKIGGHKYAIQVSTAMPMDGGLSGSTLSEAIAWGKIQYSAKKINVYMEASTGLPLLYAYLLDNNDVIKRKGLKFKL